MVKVLMNPWTIFLTLLALGGGLILGVSAINSGDDNENGGGREASRLAVEVADVVATDLRRMVRGVGTLRTIQQVELKPERAGRLIRVAFEEGNTVEAGDVLFEFDNRKLLRQQASARASLDSVEAQLTSAEIRFRRAQSLHERQAATDDELDQARADRDAAAADVRRLEADLELISEELADTRIEAPFDGIISARLVDPGTYVAVGDPLATLYQMDPLEISFAVPERHIGRVQRDQHVDVLVAAYPDRIFEGRIRYVSPSVDGATRTFEVRARVDNPDLALKPGGFAAAAVTIATDTDRLVIPEESLVATRDGYIVYTVEEDEDGELVARSASIETGLRQGGKVEVTAGLEPGQRIVRLGHMQLDEDDRLRIVEDHGADWLEQVEHPAHEPPRR